MTEAGFEVVEDELSDASRAITKAASPYACYHMAVTNPGPHGVGHVELASVFADFCRAVDKTAVAMERTAALVASGLDETAMRYEATDSSVSRLLSDLVGPAQGGIGR